MTGLRTRLPNRRANLTFAFEHAGHRFIATTAFFHNRQPGEIFLSNGRAGSSLDAAVRDSAILASLALQFGAPLAVLRKALGRDSRGVAASPIGSALDHIASDDVADQVTTVSADDDDGDAS
jgi:hypothetical protein